MRKLQISLSKDKNANGNLLQRLFSSIKNREKYNPVKEGLSDTSLKLLKATTNIVHRQYVEQFGSAKAKLKHSYIPISVLVTKLRDHLLVQEHLNSILLGPTYRRQGDFFDEPDFETLLDEIQFYDTGAVKKKLKSKSTTIERLKVSESKVKDASLVTESRGVWEEHLKDFLLDSNENWMLNQFNLLKAFVVQNSIKQTVA